MVDSEVMKHTTFGIVFLLVALATPVVYGGDPPGGVAGVEVIVKQRPSDHAVTDGRGNFAIEALAAGSYTLRFRAKRAEDLHHSISDKILVATSYSIKIEGAKRAVNKVGLTTNNLVSGVDVQVELGPGARIHGQVASVGVKNMVWIPQETGSHVPGHWVEENSAEAKAARHHNLGQWSMESVRSIQR
jgi:hypothetical protein